MKRTIELYGCLKDAGLGARASVELPRAATARQAMAALKSALGGSPLLTGCVLADEERVLAPSDRLPLTGRLAVLPPVCGG